MKNLVALGESLDLAIKHAVSRKKYWRMSRTAALRYAQRVAGATGLIVIKASLVQARFASWKRLVRTRMLGGVVAAVSNDGGYPMFGQSVATRLGLLRVARRPQGLLSVL